jgi:hypothetical protein
MWPLLAFLLLYNRIFLWGFLNYLFGIGVAFAGIALWLALERERSWLRTLASSIVALACYLSHVAAFGFYALVIIGIELCPALDGSRPQNSDRGNAVCRSCSAVFCLLAPGRGRRRQLWSVLAQSRSLVKRL